MTTDNATGLMGETSIASGRLTAKLAQEVSDAIHSAFTAGMEPDEATCVVVAVAADYARLIYGSAYLPMLASVVADRASRPEPFHHPDAGQDRGR